jgi:hypothetical protein
VALGLLIGAVELVRHHRPAEAALLGAVLVAGALAARWLARDLRAHPAGFPVWAAPPDSELHTRPHAPRGGRT